MRGEESINKNVFKLECMYGCWTLKIVIFCILFYGFFFPLFYIRIPSFYPKAFVKGFLVSVVADL